LKILVDADACPVKDDIVELAAQRELPVTLYANFHHVMPDFPGVEMICVDDAPDEADWVIANAAQKGDVVVTQDYPLASLALGKGAFALSPRGLIFTEDNIFSLLEERHRTLARIRNGKRPKKGPKPFAKGDRQKFRTAFVRILDSRGGK
jgi:uncharacterized protein YaiI (UPF0178 family)